MQTIAYLDENNLLLDVQSAYRHGHSTERALLKVFSDPIDAMGSSRLVFLSQLDLSAAFDTVDRDILRQRMSRSFGITGKSLQWIECSQCFCRVTPRKLTTGIPQGSVLRQLLFTLYTADIGTVIKAHGLFHHSYAADNQLYSSCFPSDRDILRSKIISCIEDVGQWMASNRWKLNPSKSEFLSCATARRLHLGEHSALHLSDGDVTPASSVRNLGAYFNESMDVSTNVNMLVSSSFYRLRRARTIRRSIQTSTAI